MAALFLSACAARHRLTAFRTDTRLFPDAEPLAAEACSIAAREYPSIQRLLGVQSRPEPATVTIVFLPGLQSGALGEARDATIRLDARWMTNQPGALASVLVHELVHVVQRYPASAPAHWCEGLADYVRYKLGYFEAWDCGRCGVEYPHYTSGYWCAGAFLVHLEERHGESVIHSLHAALARGETSDDWVQDATGRPLDEAWLEFQRTPAYRPEAARRVALRERLGFQGELPPPDLRDRLLALPGGHVAWQAAEYLASRVRAGTISDFGIPKPMQGSAAISIDPEILDASGSDVGHAVVCFLRFSGESWAYGFRVVHQAPFTDRSWIIERAWRRGANGDIRWLPKQGETRNAAGQVLPSQPPNLPP